MVELVLKNMLSHKELHKKAPKESSTPVGFNLHISNEASHAALSGNIYPLDSKLQLEEVWELFKICSALQL